MKGCAKSALLQLAGLLLTVGAVLYFLHWRYGLPVTKTLGVSVFSGFFAFLAWSFLASIVPVLRERASVRKCVAGERPADGRRAGFVGTIDVTGEPLRSPLGRQECVAWTYEIYELLFGHRRRTKATYFDGTALASSVITTPSGRFRLLAVPTFDFGSEDLDAGRAARNASEHIAAARFETEAPHRALEKQWTDDDGSYQSERRHAMSEPPDLAKCRFRENLIRRGEKVYAVGLYSESRGGIVPDPDWGKITRIMKGDGDSVLQQLGQRIRRYVIGSILAAGAAAALLMMFVSNVVRS